jgi:DNA invertase Pin-like site-specific DNA recombinase
MLIGYARISTTEQRLDLQLDALRAAGVEDRNIFRDTGSGFQSVRNRPGIQSCFRHLRAGDTLVVWKLDRLARSVEDLQDLLQDIKKMGCEFRSLTEGFDTKSAAGNLLLNVVSSLAQFERDQIVERTKAGLQAARERGTKLGRMPIMTDDMLRKAAAYMKAGKSRSHAARMIGVSPTTLYNYRETVTAIMLDLPDEPVPDMTPKQD